MVIGITGGIGSGKSTLSEKLRDAGYAVYDTDSAARRLQNEDAEIRKKIIAIFGTESYIDTDLNRKFIAEIVFKKPNLLQKLNELIHPAVRADFKAWSASRAANTYLFLECAILFQGDFLNLVDKIILVKAPQSIRIQRVMKRNNFTEKQVLERINNQMTDAEMVSKSDFVIDTSETDIRKMDIQRFIEKLNL